ncbi:MAG TPA: adenylate/guanylate cyclase domain-containing protein [Vicinamibacterales bacterium]|jgi:adenylate cyclase
MKDRPIDAEQQREAAALAALGRTLASIAGSRFDLDEVLQAVVEEAAQLCGADSADIAVREGSAYRQRAFIGFSPEFEELVRGVTYAPDRDSVVGRAILDGRIVHIEDVLADPDLKGNPFQAEVRLTGGIRTDLGVPIRYDGQLIGVIAAARNEVRPFSEREIGLVELFADHAAIAIVLAQTFATVERQRTELALYAPQAAELLSSAEGEQLLAGHRREISTLFADLRGFTAFAERADPEEVLGVLRQYHSTVGRLAVATGGTVEHFAGDGLMIFFNDPTPIADHQLAAVRTGCKMRDQFAALAADWRKRGYELGLGIGIATGYATVGRIGFEGRYDYAAIGTSVILASRLSSAAKAAEILISQRVMATVENWVEADAVADLELKGFSTAIAAYAVRSCRARPA